MWSAYSKGDTRFANMAVLIRSRIPKSFLCYIPTPQLQSLDSRSKKMHALASHHSAQSLLDSFDIKYRRDLLPPHSIILQHPRIDPHIFALYLQLHLRGQSINDKVVVAVRAVLVALVKFLRVFAEALFALFAGKDHFGLFKERVGFGFGMTFGAVEPFFAWTQRQFGKGRGFKESVNEGRTHSKAERIET